MLPHVFVTVVIPLVTVSSGLSTWRDSRKDSRTPKSMMIWCLTWESQSCKLLRFLVKFLHNDREMFSNMSIWIAEQEQVLDERSAEQLWWK